MTVGRYYTHNNVSGDEVCSRALSALKQKAPSGEYVVTTERVHRHAYVIEIHKWPDGTLLIDRFIRRWSKSLKFHTSWTFKDLSNGIGRAPVPDNWRKKS